MRRWEVEHYSYVRDGGGWEWMKYCSCTGGGDRVGWEMSEERGVL